MMGQRSKHQVFHTAVLQIRFFSMFLLPGANSHFVGVVDVWTAVSTVTLAKAVVVHAVLPRLLLLASVSYDGETPLDRTAYFRKQTNHRYPLMNNQQLAVSKEGKLYCGLVFCIT